MPKDTERLQQERASIAGRLTGFLLWQSVLALTFAELLPHALILAQILSILGVGSALIGVANFWTVPSLIDSLEGRKDHGIRRAVTRMFHGRGLVVVPITLVYTGG